STVIELCDDLDADKDVVEACASLHGMGYAIALDNVARESNVDALLPFAKYAKIDVLVTSPVDRAELAKRLLPLGTQLVAANVDTLEAAQSVRAAGFHLVQGFYFCRPRTFSSRTLSARRSAYVRLLAALNRRAPRLRRRQRRSLARLSCPAFRELGCL